MLISIKILSMGVIKSHFWKLTVAAFIFWSLQWGLLNGPKLNKFSYKCFPVRVWLWVKGTTVGLQIKFLANVTNWINIKLSSLRVLNSYVDIVLYRAMFNCYYQGKAFLTTLYRKSLLTRYTFTFTSNSLEVSIILLISWNSNIEAITQIFL